MKSLFKSQSGKKALMDLYHQKRNALHIESYSKHVGTTYGNTNVIMTTDASKPPILLIHGSNGCAPIALETYAGLESHFQVFAVDVLAQPNKSAETRLSMKTDDYGKWLHEVIDALELKNVTLAGFSFGGLVILKTLEYKEDNIKAVFLTAPAYIVNGNPLKALIKVFIPMKRYMKTKNSKHVQRFLNALFTEPDPFATQFLSKVFLQFHMDFTPVPIIKDTAAQLITTPIALFAAKNDLMFPGEKMIKRAKHIFPSLQDVVLLEQSKHVQNNIDNQRIVDLIKNSNY